MRVSELGEFGLINHLAAVLAGHEDGRRTAASGPPGSTLKARLLLGIGDDAAVWQAGDVLELATTDTMVSGVHFRPGDAPWRDLGWKALAVNLSDIAAMGGAPHFALVTLGLPGDTEVEPLAELYRGMMDAATAYGARIVGGDVVAAPVLFITVALNGSTTGTYPDGVLRRAAARPGDLVAVTGYLGSSAAGLQTLLSDHQVSPEVRTLLRTAHFRPQPRVVEGQLLLRAGVRCAMDISDGLLADLTKLCTASGVSARVEQEQVPVRSAVRASFPDRWRSLALTGGEDYELLFTAPAAVVARVQAASSVPVTIIGAIEGGETGQVTLLDAEGRAVPWQGGGWDHLTETIR